MSGLDPDPIGCVTNLSSGSVIQICGLDPDRKKYFRSWHRLRRTLETKFVFFDTLLIDFILFFSFFQASTPRRPRPLPWRQHNQRRKYPWTRLLAQSAVHAYSEQLCVLYRTAALIFHPPLAYLPSLSDFKMGRRPARCYRYCKNKPYPKSRFNRYDFHFKKI